MKVKSIFYEAKDGKIFTDPLACEDYEKTIGVLPNSVADIITVLEKHDPDQYVNAVMVVRNTDGKIYVLNYFTVCCDCKLTLFTNPDSLDQDQRYITSTFAELIKWLKGFDKDCPCQYMITYSSDIIMTNVGIMANFSQRVWDGKEEEK